MGLLDVLNSDQGRLGLGLLAAAGGRSDGAGFGQRMAEGLGSYDHWKKQQAQAKLQKMQEEEMQAQIEARKAKAVEDARIKALIQGAGQPKLGMGAGLPAGTLPGEFDIGGTPALQQPGKIDAQDLIRQRVPPELVKQLIESANWGRDEVARVEETTDAQGRPVKKQFSKFGTPIGQDMGVWKAPLSLDRGGSSDYIDPVTLKPLGSFPKTMSFSDRNAAASQSLARERFNYDKTQNTVNGAKAPSGYRYTANGNLEFIPGGPADLTANASTKLTEDQGKATGWLVQAENAFKNMKAATKDDKSSAKPGFNDALAAIPSFGATEALANSMRGANRQKFMQAASSLSEALLRAATGAGVNRDEAIQKVRELTPQFGDDDELIAQKEAAIPAYIESLKVRAGPGAAQAAKIGGGASGGWSIEKAK